jgi:aryl-alcohol dehydrogenase-like predicted oxidoreductase
LFLIRLDHLREGDRKLYYNETNMRRFEKAKELAQRHSVSVTEIALSYLTSQTTPTFPIVGCRTPDQLHESLKAINLNLTTGEIAYLENGSP